MHAISKVPCPEFDILSGDALDRMATEFYRLSAMPLLPAYMVIEDKTRTRINDSVSEMLGVPDYDTCSLAKVWCAKPSVRGPK